MAATARRPFGQAEREGEDRTAARIVFERQRAAHQADELARDGEPEPRALEAAGVGAVPLLELFEDRRAPLRRHPGPGVGHREAQRPPFAPRSTETQTPPAEVNFTALPARFISTCLRRIPSASTKRGAGR